MESHHVMAVCLSGHDYELAVLRDGRIDPSMPGAPIEWCPEPGCGRKWATVEVRALTMGNTTGQRIHTADLLIAFESGDADDLYADDIVQLDTE